MAAVSADVLTYWLTAGPVKWFAKSAAFDEASRLRFEPVHYAASRGRYEIWEETAEGCAALLILLDQIPRNLYRDSGHAFATDPLARRIARHAIARGFDETIDPLLRQFFYIPFEHSEDMADQKLCVELFASAGDAEGLKWAKVHLEIVAQFGRFPHRNKALGRDMTAAEQAFLDEGGFAG